MACLPAVHHTNAKILIWKTNSDILSFKFYRNKNCKRNCTGGQHCIHSDMTATYKETFGSSNLAIQRFSNLLDHRITVGGDEHCFVSLPPDDILDVTQNYFRRWKAQFRCHLAGLEVVAEALGGCEQMSTVAIFNVFTHIHLHSYIKKKYYQYIVQDNILKDKNLVF